MLHSNGSRAHASQVNCQQVNEEAEQVERVEVATRVTEKLLAREHSNCLKKLILIAEARAKALPKFLADFYQTLKRSKEQCILIAAGTCMQTEELWVKERSCKVTGSIVYGLYTYTKNKAPNWDQKLEKVYHSFHGNEHTVYGLQCEPIARQHYATSCKEKVVEIGLFVRPELPFLGYSADGIIVDKDDNPQWLLEIKSLEVGKTHPADQLFDVASCCSKKTKGLKTRHPYYGQIQLGMLLLSLTRCDFMLHSSVENDGSLGVEEVDFDEAFAYEMVSCIINLYFDRILPWLYKNQQSTPAAEEV